MAAWVERDPVDRARAAGIISARRGHGIDGVWLARIGNYDWPMRQLRISIRSWASRIFRSTNALPPPPAYRMAARHSTVCPGVGPRPRYIVAAVAPRSAPCTRHG